MMKALVVCHKVEKDHGIFDQLLKQRGYEIDLRMGYHDTLVTEDPLAHDLAIFMGGPMGVYQSDIFPYLNNEIAYLEKRVAADRPTLGICLGAQMIAKSQGKQVYPGSNGKEVGWKSIHVNEAGQQMALRHLDQNYPQMMQWHGDTFDLPDNATLLASSEQYKNQAYKIGQNILGCQFHPEVTMDGIEFWLMVGLAELGDLNMTVPDLRDASLENIQKLNQQSAIFFQEWLDQVN